MDINIKSPIWGKNFLIFLIIIGILGGGFIFWDWMFSRAETVAGQVSLLEKIEQIPIMNENTLLAITGPYFPDSKAAEKIKVIATAYSSTVCQTDSDPYITAAGTWVRKGIVANNLLPFGTEIRIPELFGNKVFVIEDRMNSRKGNYHIDIWFPSYQEAVNFGAKRTYIEILGI